MDLKRLEELFHAACDLPADERAAFLDSQFDRADEAGEGEMRRKLEAMLRTADAGDETLPRPVVLSSGSASSGEAAGDLFDLQPDLQPGVRIGRYRLLERLGEGGFGVVYLAEQLEPVRREVALKVVKLGMDTREVVARFEAERQALAMMDHRSIAQVLDGGVLDGGVAQGRPYAGRPYAGRPYFVMELVRGEPITTFCDARDLGLRQRLELFVEVCEAVQHAHQKGVVHRDLKPSNVLVREPDTGHGSDPGSVGAGSSSASRAIPKVIDFGIAKALHGRLTEQTLHSAAYRMLGTPSYMSPEQAAGDVDVDTRSDVYSLGVLLYELLTRRTPLDAGCGSVGSNDRIEVGLSEIERRIREEEPPKPSRVVVQVGADSFGPRLRGDLDWIALRALEKDRERRYASASELAEDVRRHLRDEPVAAGPPSATYRLKKFLRRYRVQSVLAALLLLAIVGGALGTVGGLVEASRQRDAARVETERARAATDFLVETLALADPEVALEPDLSVRTLLDQAAARADRSLAGQPEAEARVRSTLGRAYESLGEHALAEPQLRAAVELSDAYGGLGPRDLYDTLWTLTHVLHRVEKPDAQEAAHRARQVAHDLVRRQHPELAGVLDDFIVEIRSGVHHPDPEPIDRAQGLLARARELARERLRDDDPLWPLLADGCMDAGFSLWYTPHEARSDVFFGCALDIRRRVLPASHPDVGESAGMLAGVLNRSGRAAEAEEMLRRVLADMEQVFEADDFQVAFTRAMLGENLTAQGRFAEAEPLLLQSHEVLSRVTDDIATFFPIDSFGRLIRLYDAWGRPDAAAPHRRALAEISARSSWPIPWPFTRWIMVEPAPAPYADVLPILDRLDALCGGVAYGAEKGDLTSDELSGPVREIRDAATLLDHDDPRTTVIGRLLVAWSNSAAPESQIRPRMAELALDLMRPRLDRLPLDAAEAHVWAAVGASADERKVHLAEARRHLHRMADWKAITGDDHLGGTRYGDHWFIANGKTRIARGFVQLGLDDEARPLLESALATLRVQLGEENRGYVATRELLANLGSRSSRDPE